MDYEEVATKHYDEHTHEAMYVRSDEMKIRSMSAEAQSIIQKLSANVAHRRPLVLMVTSATVAKAKPHAKASG